MSVVCSEENRRLTAAVSGELDHHRAREIMEELDRRIDTVLPRQLILDLRELSFTDSSGIAVLLRCYKRVQAVRGTMKVVHTPPQAEKVFRAAGLQRIIPFEKGDEQAK